MFDPSHGAAMAVVQQLVDGELHTPRHGVDQLDRFVLLNAEFFVVHISISWLAHLLGIA